MATDHEDVRGHDFPKERRPPVTLPTMLGHVWPHARRDVEINRSHRLDLDPSHSHELHRAIQKELGVGRLGRALDGAVDEKTLRSDRSRCSIEGSLTDAG